MISIVIPTYNRSDALKNCIESIIPQVVPRLEVIIVNDGSKDNTSEYLRILVNESSFVKVISNEKNLGVNVARNQGVQEAVGTFVLFLDSDDRLSPDSLANIIFYLEQFPGINHFLFLVSDRAAEFQHKHLVERICYDDWLRGRFSGDFVHMLTRVTLNRFRFFEQFRMFESLNWLRIKQHTSPQLFVPFVAVERDRGRMDSLTISSKLQSLEVIDAKFEAQKLYYAMYHQDLQQFQSKSLSFKLLEAIILGVACDKKNDCKAMLRYAGTRFIRFIGLLLIAIPPVIARRIIIHYSSIK